MQNDIWEFRTKYAGQQIRLLAFWDKTDKKVTLVIATHGFIKKVDKVPANEIKRAVRLKEQYFECKTENYNIATKKMKNYTIADMKKEFIGQLGTPEREEYDDERHLEVI